MSDFQRIVSVLPNGTTNHNILRDAIALLDSALESRGLEHVILDGMADSFPHELIGLASDPANAIYLGHRFYDMHLTYSDIGRSVRRNLFEVLDRPVFATILDHPFSDFMWSRIAAASRTTHFLLPSPEFRAEARFINPQLEHFHSVSSALTEPEVASQELRPLSERPIDLFMPCAFIKGATDLWEIRKDYADQHSPMAGVIDEVYETGLHERDRPLITLFLDAFERHYRRPLILEFPLRPRDFSMLDVLSNIDTRIRFERRMSTLRALAKLDPSLRIVVTGDPALRDTVPELMDRPNIELTARVESDLARKILLHAKFAINVLPTYVSMVTERVTNAMALGCCVISDRNRHLAATFAEDREILFMAGCDPAGLQRYFREDLGEAQAIAGRAQRKALAEFSVSRFADNILDVMQAVF